MTTLFDFLSEERISDAGMYGLIAFSLFCPGFAFLLVMHPEVVKDYDFSKLLLYCASVSGPCLLAFFVVVDLSLVGSDRQLKLKSHLMFSAAVSSAAIYFVLGLMVSHSIVSLSIFIDGIHVALVLIGFVVSYITSSTERNRFSRLFFSFGGLFSLTLAPKVAGFFL